MTKASFARMLRSAGARRRTRPLAGSSCPVMSQHSNLAPDAAAEQSSGADAHAREAENLCHSPSCAPPLQTVSNSLTAMNGVLISGFQAMLVETATASFADALAGPAAPPSLRLRLRQGLRTATFLGYVAEHLVRTGGLVASLTRAADAPPGLATWVGLSYEVCTALLLLQAAAVVVVVAPPGWTPSLLLRAIAVASALAGEGFDVDAAVEGIAQHPELDEGVRKVVVLMMTCFSRVDSCLELAEVARAAAVVVQRAAEAATQQQLEQQRGEQRDARNCGDGGER